MNEQMYRVVLTGKLAPGFQREQVMAALAKELQTSAAKLLPVFEGRELPIEDVLTAHDAAVLQRRLEHLGASTRVDRVLASEMQDRHEVSGLHLPRGGDPAEAGLMHCPACGHAQLVAKSCDECGVVFADYNRDHAQPAFEQAAKVTRPAGRPSKSTRQARRLSPQDRRDIHADFGWREDWVDEDATAPAPSPSQSRCHQPANRC